MFKRIAMELYKEFPYHSHILIFEDCVDNISVELIIDSGNEHHLYHYDRENLDKAWKKFHSLMGKYLSQGFEVSQSVIETLESQD